MQPKELAYGVCEAIRLFDVGGVPSSRNDHQAGVRKLVHESLRDVEPGHAVVLADCAGHTAREAATAFPKENLALPINPKTSALTVYSLARAVHSALAPVVY